MSATARVLDPGSTIGILGGGQLGRMLALAAARLGFQCHVFAPNPDSPAFDVVQRSTRADYTDTEALDRFAADVDVVTYEFENVPAEAAAFLSARVPVLPDPNVLATTQDRLAEKNFIAGLGIGTAACAGVSSPRRIAAALDRMGRPAVLKTRRFGYDGKGQVTIRAGDDPEHAWREVGAQPCILEAFVPFALRSIRHRRARPRRHGRMFRRDGERAPQSYFENFARTGGVAGRHRGGGAAHRRNHRAEVRLCRRAGGGVVRAPATAACWSTRSRRGCTIPATGRSTARRCRSSSSISARSPGGRWRSRVRHGRVEMCNLIGSEIDDYRSWLTVPGAAVHLYGKSPIRPGRKMGHVTRVFPDKAVAAPAGGNRTGWRRQWTLWRQFC